MTDQTPDDAAEDQPQARARREQEHREDRDQSAEPQMSTNDEPETPAPLVPEDEREYPVLDDAIHTTDRDGTPIIVAPSTYGRGYQTVTVNPDRPHDHRGRAGPDEHRLRR